MLPCKSNPFSGKFCGFPIKKHHVKRNRGEKEPVLPQKNCSRTKRNAKMSRFRDHFYGCSGECGVPREPNVRPRPRVNLPVPGASRSDWTKNETQKCPPPPFGFLLQKEETNRNFCGDGYLKITLPQCKLRESLNPQHFRETEDNEKYIAGTVSEKTADDRSGLSKLAEFGQNADFRY